MDIKTITPIHQPPIAAAAAPVNPYKIPLSEHQVTEKDTISIGTVFPEKTSKLGFLNDDSNSIALLAKETDRKLALLADSIDKMTGALDAIIKNFPPFSPEDAARKDLLMSYASIRKELLQLTFPPPPPPVYEKVQRQWQELFQQDESSITIKLPGDITASTSDSDLKTIAAGLTTLHDGVTSLRTDMKRAILTN